MKPQELTKLEVALYHHSAAPHHHLGGLMAHGVHLQWHEPVELRTFITTDLEKALWANSFQVLTLLYWKITRLAPSSWRPVATILLGMLFVSIQPSEVFNNSRLIREHGHKNTSVWNGWGPQKVTHGRSVSFISEKNHVSWCRPCHNRSWHLHALHNKPDQPELFTAAVWHRQKKRKSTFFRAHTGDKKNANQPFLGLRQFHMYSSNWHCTHVHMYSSYQPE